MRESFPSFEREVAGSDDATKRDQPFGALPDDASGNPPANREPAAPTKRGTRGETAVAELPPEVREYQERTQKLIDGHKRLFATFAKDVSLSFKVSNGFYIGH